MRVSHRPARTGIAPARRHASTATVGPTSPSIGPSIMASSPGSANAWRRKRPSISSQSRRLKTRLSLRPEVPEVVNSPIQDSRGLQV